MVTRQQTDPYSVVGRKTDEGLWALPKICQVSASILNFGFRTVVNGKNNFRRFFEKIINNPKNGYNSFSVQKSTVLKLRDLGKMN